MRFWDNPKLVTRGTVLSQILLELGNISQLIRMWTEHTAKGQSLIAWVSVNLAILLWLNFYRVCVPADQRKWPIIGTVIGWIMNVAVILTVAYFRFISPQ